MLERLQMEFDVLGLYLSAHPLGFLSRDSGGFFLRPRHRVLQRRDRSPHDLCDGLARLFVKDEALNPTGSFKARGMSNRIATLGPEARAQGVITLSAGNAGQSSTSSA